ncbi:MAG: polysaccharide biosynthesis C-terminal domain-containing protein, partial [Oscillospiraceae bacterium]|nr:polysaccharide biosynthesis C-terminal domain-containing protein [Oscillospiraceae bacterium]
VCTLLCLLFSRGLIGIFIQSGSDSLEYGARFLRILCLGAPFSACAYACISFFQAVGRGKKSFLLAILRKGILDIPLMFILQAVLPVYGIVLATPIADLVCCVLALWLFFRFLRKHASRGVSQGVAANSGTAA